MKDEIRTYLNDPKRLEKLYRANKPHFKQQFSLIYPELKGNTLAEVWNERLNYEREGTTWGTRREVVFIIAICLVAGIIAKLPAVLKLDEAFFYTRNAGFIVFPALCSWFAWKNKLSSGKSVIMAISILASLIFINLLPHNSNSDTLD